MSEHKTVSDSIREYIELIQKQNPDYFAQTKPRERNQDFQNFCQKEKQLDYEKHRTIFVELLVKYCKQNEIPLQKGKTQASTPKPEQFKVTKGTQLGNVTINPKEPRQREPNSAEDNTQLQVAGQPNQQSQQGQEKNKQLHPPNCQCFDCKRTRDEVTEIDPEEAGAILEIMVDLWHARNENVKPMTPEEVRMVGKRLKPIIERHLGGDILMYGLALVTVGKIVTERVSQAKQGRKKQTKKQTVQQEQKPQDPEEPQRDDNIAKKRKFFNSRKIEEITKEGAKDD